MIKINKMSKLFLAMLLLRVYIIRSYCLVLNEEINSFHKIKLCVKMYGIDFKNVK